MLKPFAAILLLASVFCAGCADQVTAPLSDASRDGQSPLASRGQRFETGFLTEMIDLNQAGVDMARLCPGRAIHPELEALAAEMEADLVTEIAVMQSMLLQWYGITYTPAASGTGRLGSLTGADFEEAFLTRMVRHHEQVIQNARRGVARAEHTSLIALCVEMADERFAENSVMKSWSCTWYGNCR